MAVHGRRTKVYVQGVDLTAFLRSANLQRTADVAESTPFNNEAKGYTVGMRDGTMAFEGLYDGTAAAIDEVLASILGATSQKVALVPVGVEALGSVACGMAGDESSYDVDTATDDVATVSVEMQSSTSIDRCLVHKVLGAVSSGANGTSIDNGAASANGGVGYLHVTAASGGGTLTVKVQHSADDTTWADLVTFADVTAVGAERKTVSGTVNRYTRATHAITAGSQTYVMAFGRKTF